MTRVVLTGADGYIGRSVRDALCMQDFEVHALSRTARSNDGSTIWHAVDLFDTAATEAALSTIAATHLVHLAWVTQPGAYWDSDDNARWQDASDHLLNVFSANGGQRAVLAGTCAEYDLSDGHCIEDATPLRAQSAYTASKLRFRHAAFALASRTDLEVAWARVFFSFGPHEHRQRLVPDIINQLITGGRAACSDGKQVRDFMYVRDLAAALVAVLTSRFCGDINLASGKAMTVRQLATMIGEKLDAVSHIDFGARARQQNEPDSITADTARLNRDVGWNSGRSLDEAIDETIAWWREQTPSQA